MEQKMASSTSGDVSQASQAHYAAENQIMDAVKNMTLAGKKKLAAKMQDHADAAEAEAKS